RSQSVRRPRALFLALSGHRETVCYLSAFGAKRTLTEPALTETGFMSTRPNLPTNPPLDYRSHCARLYGVASTLRDERAHSSKGITRQLLSPARPKTGGAFSWASFPARWEQISNADAKLRTERPPRCTRKGVASI